MTQSTFPLSDYRVPSHTAMVKRSAIMATLLRNAEASSSRGGDDPALSTQIVTEASSSRGGDDPAPAQPQLKRMRNHYPLELFPLEPEGSVEEECPGASIGRAQRFDWWSHGYGGQGSCQQRSGEGVASGVSASRWNHDKIRLAVRLQPAKLEEHDTADKLDEKDTRALLVRRSPRRPPPAHLLAHYQRPHQPNASPPAHRGRGLAHYQRPHQPDYPPGEQPWKRPRM